MGRTVNCYVNLEFDKQKMVEQHTMTGMTVLRCFKTVTVVLGHPVWQTARPLWYQGLGLFRDKNNRDQAVWALERFLGPSKEHGKGPEMTIISTDCFVDKASEDSLREQIARIGRLREFSG